MADNADRLERNAGGYNEVGIERVPGGFSITLNHRATSDEACIVFVPEDKIIFWDEYDDDDELQKAHDEIIGRPLSFGKED